MEYDKSSYEKTYTGFPDEAVRKGIRDTLSDFPAIKVTSNKSGQSWIITAQLLGHTDSNYPLDFFDALTYNIQTAAFQN